MIRAILGAIVGCVLVAGCERVELKPRLVYVLFDVSKTYAPNKKATLERATEISKSLRGGDRFMFATIGDCSFGRQNVFIDAEIPTREDFAARAKLALFEEIDRLKRRLRSQNSTDITGALWEFHRQSDGVAYAPRVLVIFSDLEEDVAGSQCRAGREEPPPLDGTIVLLASVGELEGDRLDPTRYFARVEAFDAMLRAAGADDVRVVTGAPNRVRAAAEQALEVNN